MAYWVLQSLMIFYVLCQDFYKALDEIKSATSSGEVKVCQLLSTTLSMAGYSIAYRSPFS